MRESRLDDPQTTQGRREILRGKGFLRRIYGSWYGLLKEAIPGGPGKVLEIGSGAGFFREVCEEAIASEILAAPGVSLVLDARRLPFREGSLRAVVMTDVLHHIANVREFFAEARRAVRLGGVIAMIEPWNTPWSRLIYRNFHHEPFQPDAPGWELPEGGPLSIANGALPWIVLRRDRERFEAEFPEWRVATIKEMMPLRYLLSGGFSAPGLQPEWTYPAWSALEDAVGSVNRYCGMFAFILLEKVANH